MIFAGVTTLFTMTLPETYAPALLKKRAHQLREKTGDYTITTEQELFKASLGQILTETLFRPFRKSCFFTCPPALATDIPSQR